MPSLTSLVLAASEGAEHAVEPPLPPLAMGIGTFAILVALLVITWQFHRGD
jgi:hypothetical protein